MNLRIDIGIKLNSRCLKIEDVAIALKFLAALRVRNIRYKASWMSALPIRMNNEGRERALSWKKMAKT